MKKLILVLALSLVSSIAAFAESKSDGCGLGWEITQKQTMIATTTRGTTNAFVPPSFGMTTGTMGCAKHDIAKKDEAAAVFASANFEPLMLEMAQGQGEYLTGFARTMGCDDSAVGEFGRMTQKNFGSFSGSSDSIDLFKKVKNEIRSNAVLMNNCSA